jgi:ABC-2 type transport system permease protein
MSGWRTLLPNAWYVAVREFRSRTRTRSFALGTILLATIAFAVTQLPVAIDAVAGASQTRLAVVTQADGLPADAQAVLDQQLNGGSTQKQYEITWLAGDAAAAAQNDLEQGKYDALLIVARAAGGSLSFTLRTDMPSDGRQVVSISGACRWLALEDGLARAGTSISAVVQTPVALLPVSSSETAKVNNLTNEISMNLLSTGLIVLIFMAIVTYGVWVAMSVAEEKGSRVMELMLNATTPLQMLAGKVVGNGAAGLAQYGTILGAVVVGLLLQGPIHESVLGGSGGDSPFAGLTPSVFAAFVVLFVGGFMLYSLLYAALGSLVSRQEDVQSATSPLMMLVFVGYFASIFALQAIDETWVKVLSFVPFFSPYLMLARVAMGHVELWEFVLALVLMAATIAVALVVAARIYSAGVLLYGQRVSLRQVLKAARVSR